MFQLRSFVKIAVNLMVDGHLSKFCPDFHERRLFFKATTMFGNKCLSRNFPSLRMDDLKTTVPDTLTPFRICDSDSFVPYSKHTEYA